jgi:hypothetical protein
MADTGFPRRGRCVKEEWRKGQGHLYTHMDRLSRASCTAIISLEEYQRRRRSLKEKIQALYAHLTS